MTVGSQMQELDRGGGGGEGLHPHKIGSQNTPYKLGLKIKCNDLLLSNLNPALHVGVIMVSRMFAIRLLTLFDMGNMMAPKMF